MIYAGVGSRDAPPFACQLAIKVGMRLRREGVLLRSGHAEGMDESFEKGHDIATHELNSVPLKEIYLPEAGFRGSDSQLIGASIDATLTAKRIHPNWQACNRFARDAHSRNIHQLLGEKLDSPADFVVCWTQDGAPVGGTRTVIVLAEECGIPVFNMGAYSPYDVAVECKNFLNKFF